MTDRTSWSLNPRGGIPSRYALIVLTALCVAGLISAVLAVTVQRTAKHAGSPLVEFEIALPPGILLPDDRNISVTLWYGNSGTGCKAIEVRRSGSRPVVAGKFLGGRSDGPPRLSLRLSRYAEGYWPMPVEPHAAPETAFGVWRRIEFMQSPRTEDSPLPPGQYDVRYRVAKYM